jgi:uncharacterized membrane protein YcaP (DUF421 family)
METVIRGIVIYIILLIVVRVTGRRSLAEITAFDLVLLLIIAETTQQALLGDDFSLVNSFILILTLFSVDIAFSYLKEWSPRADRIIDGAPTVLVSLGKLDEEALRWSRVGVDDLLQAARAQHEVERLDQIKFAVLEASGDISIIPQEQNS